MNRESLNDSLLSSRTLNNKRNWKKIISFSLILLSGSFHNRFLPPSLTSSSSSTGTFFLITEICYQICSVVFWANDYTKKAYITMWWLIMVNCIQIWWYKRQEEHAWTVRLPTWYEKGFSYIISCNIRHTLLLSHNAAVEGRQLHTMLQNYIL